ncbi:MAG: hypothetical protein D3910_15360 [Candidatus Electrothrix sp. ATG2]|nr:hypothetical protein [Candidatus Electrothrix sp. ATG2]
MKRRNVLAPVSQSKIKPHSHVGYRAAGSQIPNPNTLLYKQEKRHGIKGGGFELSLFNFTLTLFTSHVFAESLFLCPSYFSPDASRGFPAALLTAKRVKAHQRVFLL